MATIRKRFGRWQVQIRRVGMRSINKTFAQCKDAEVWARGVEVHLEREDTFLISRRSVDAMLYDLLMRYKGEVTPTKKSAVQESARIGLISRDPLAQFSVKKVSPELLAAFRDQRLVNVSTGTVRQDLVLIRQVIETARREWGLRLPRNPVDDVRKPKPSESRTRRLEVGELEELQKALSTTRNPAIGDVITFAIATGMRRGEILRVRFDQIDWERQPLVIPIAKSGHPRTIPLRNSAVALLEKRAIGKDKNELAFPVTANAFRLAWERLKRRAGIKDLRFHDLRHEAISSFFEDGLSLPEVALISGHRDPRQLFRYTHLDAAKIASKLNS